MVDEAIGPTPFCASPVPLNRTEFPSRTHRQRFSNPSGKEHRGGRLAGRVPRRQRHRLNDGIGGRGAPATSPAADDRGQYSVGALLTNLRLASDLDLRLDTVIRLPVPTTPANLGGLASLFGHPFLGLILFAARCSACSSDRLRDRGTHPDSGSGTRFEPAALPCQSSFLLTNTQSYTSGPGTGLGRVNRPRPARVTSSTTCSRCRV